jgi:hypothetical protein
MCAATARGCPAASPHRPAVSGRSRHARRPTGITLTSPLRLQPNRPTRGRRPTAPPASLPAQACTQRRGSPQPAARHAKLSTSMLVDIRRAVADETRRPLRRSRSLSLERDHLTPRQCRRRRARAAKAAPDASLGNPRWQPPCAQYRSVWKRRQLWSAEPPPSSQAGSSRARDEPANHRQSYTIRRQCYRGHPASLIISAIHRAEWGAQLDGQPPEAPSQRTLAAVSQVSQRHGMSTPCRGQRGAEDMLPVANADLRPQRLTPPRDPARDCLQRRTRR